MKLSPEEQDALIHHRKMHHIRTKNLYILEEQEASFGSLNVPSHILSQIDKITEQLRHHSEEINRLETLAVQDQIPLAEVEYRVYLAEAWDTPDSYPTVVGKTRLDFARLRLHIAVARAKELEWDIRRELASERIRKLKTSPASIAPYRDFVSQVHSASYSRDYEKEHDIIRPMNTIIRLHPIPVLEYINSFSRIIGRDSKNNLIVKYKNRWLQILGAYFPHNEEEYLKQALHFHLEPKRPFNANEWEELELF